MWGFLFSAGLLGVLFVSCTWTGFSLVGYQEFGRFSFTVLPKMFSAPLTWNSSHSPVPIIHRLVLFYGVPKVSHAPFLH